MEGYRPPTEIRIGHLTASFTSTPAEGAAEALYFFRTYSKFRPVGPFHDRRNGQNGRIRRFRLEASDKTAVSYVVDRNIDVQGITAIKLEDKERKVSKVKSKRATIPRREQIVDKIQSKKDQEVKRKPEAEIAAASTIDQPSSFQTRSSFLVRTDQCQHTANATEKQPFPEQPEKVTLSDLVVDRLISVCGLTRDEKELFLQHIRPIAQALRIRGVDPVLESEYIHYCIDVLANAYGENYYKQKMDSKMQGSLKNQTGNEENKRLKTHEAA